MPEVVHTVAGTHVTPTQTIERIALAFHLSFDELLSRRRTARVAWARQVAWYALHEGFDMSYPEIGEAFERNHTTVMYGVHKVRAIAAEDSELAKHLEQLLVNIRTANLEAIG